MLAQLENNNTNILISKETTISLSGKSPKQILPNLQKNPIQQKKPSPPHEKPVNNPEIESLKNNSTIPSIEQKSENEKIGENIINLSAKPKDKKDFTEKKRRRRSKCSYSSKRQKKSKSKITIPPLINLSKKNDSDPLPPAPEQPSNLILSEYHSSSGAIKFDPSVNTVQNDNNQTSKKKQKISEKERIANAEKEFLDKLNQEYSDEQYKNDMDKILKEEKELFMQKNFPIMYRKDKYYLYNILLNKRRTQPIHFINPNLLSNSLQESKKLQTLYLNEEPEKMELNTSDNIDEEKEKNNQNNQKQNSENNTEEEQLEQIKQSLSETEIKNKTIRENKFISNQKNPINKKRNTGMSDTSPSENNHNSEDGDKIGGLKFKKLYNTLPKHVWSMPEDEKELDVDLFYDDCIQIWPFNECTFVKEIALEFLMKNDYSTDVCLKRLKDFVTFMKKRAGELDISILNKNEKTIKNYSLRKTKYN